MESALGAVVQNSVHLVEDALYRRLDALDGLGEKYTKVPVRVLNQRSHLRIEKWECMG